ncbi:MAG: hypothetical protein H0V23_10730 [Nocardioidaceae bacterium]|nr:hypothetical protein [Nocardioidaceae bacterium]
MPERHRRTADQQQIALSSTVVKATGQVIEERGELFWRKSGAGHHAYDRS